LLLEHYNTVGRWQAKSAGAGEYKTVRPMKISGSHTARQGDKRQRSKRVSPFVWDDGFIFGDDGEQS